MPMINDYTATQTDFNLRPPNQIPVTMTETTADTTKGDHGKNYPDDENPYDPDERNLKEAYKNRDIVMATIKLSIPTSNFTIQVPTHLTTFFDIFSQVDPEALILPFDKGESSNKILVPKDKIPSDQENLKMWFRCMEIKENAKVKSQKSLVFRCRMAIVKTVKEIRDGLMKWLIANASSINFDRLYCEHTTTLGWLYGIDPDLHQRDKLNNQILNIQEQNNKRVTKLALFPRTIYEGESGMKEKTRAVVIVVPTEIAPEARNLLFKWSSMKKKYYTNAQLITFGKNEENPSLLKDMITRQNVFKHNLTKRTLHELTLVDIPHFTKNNTEMSFQDWILSIPHP